MKDLGCTLGLETGAPSRLAPLPATRAWTPGRGGVDPSVVAAKRWGVTRRTSMSDTSEQLDGGPGIRSDVHRNVGGGLLLINSKGGQILAFGIICLSALRSDQILRVARLVACAHPHRASLKQPPLTSPCEGK